ncbi:metalloregulator ArsR/SmtB family transcription factor [Thalassotalea euphylliae]|uniref:metalloregulator ArsR/SmtB family transcription factor n=1 Tax=Thalassotalea euphylliae TaxID=1655234 RepID=UPI0036427BC8
MKESSTKKKAKKKSVLFLCTGNSARSQMAEAILRHKAGDRFDVQSAGMHPETVDPRTVKALQQFGLPSEGLHSKGLESFSGKSFDYVISLCDKAAQECRVFEGAKTQLAWDFPDPKTRIGIDPFAATVAELANRISMFLLIDDKSAVTQVEEDIDPIAFFKCLTDDIRLKTLLLTNYHGELCVCELMEALSEESQPKVSRNLAVLKKANVISDRKNGQWVFYRINPSLPQWAKNTIAQTTESNVSLIAPHIERLANMENRPDKVSFCK